MNETEKRQRLLNGAMFHKIQIAFQEIQKEEGMDEISHTEALEALRYAMEKLNGLPIQF